MSRDIILTRESRMTCLFIKLLWRLHFVWAIKICTSTRDCCRCTSQLICGGTNFRSHLHFIYNNHKTVWYRFFTTNLIQMHPYSNPHLLILNNLLEWLVSNIKMANCSLTTRWIIREPMFSVRSIGTYDQETCNEVVVPDCGYIHSTFSPKF